MNIDNTTLTTRPIKKATVYPDSARITRSLAIKVKEGITNISVKDLPQNLYWDSISANIKNNDNAIIKNINTKEYFVKSIKEEELKALQEKLKLLRRELTFIYEEVNRLQLEFDEIANTSVTPPYKAESKLIPMPLNHKNWEEYFNFVENKLTLNREELRKLLLKSIKFRKEINKLEKEEFTLLSYSSTKTYGIEITILSNISCEAELEINYIVPGAWWFPVYDLHISPEENLATLYTNGIIQQTTGEDWVDISLLLSTASPSYSADIVKLTSWRIKQADTEIIVNRAEEASSKYDKSKMKSPKLLRSEDMLEEKAIFDEIVSKTETTKKEMKSNSEKEGLKRKRRSSMKKSKSGAFNKRNYSI